MCIRDSLLAINRVNLVFRRLQRERKPPMKEMRVGDLGRRWGPMMVINDLEESGSGLDVPCGVIGLASSLTKSAFSVCCS